MPAKPAKGVKPSKAADEVVVGDRAPDVALWDQDGKKFRLRDLRGQPVVLYFYPKDMTSGCTTEACQFQEQLPDFEGLDAVIVGVSPDDAASHRKFRAKHGLGFTLAYGEGHEALEAFGVWKEKSMYGRKYMGVERSTFLLGPDGTVAGAWRKVQPDGHAAAVLEAVRALGEK